MPTEQDVADALRTIEPLWAELFPAEKERIARNKALKKLTDALMPPAS